MTDDDRSLVLTDEDFSRAYLTEGWARRFLFEAFQAYTVLFVDYSHDDVMMTYLARSLPANSVRFALIPNGQEDKWDPLGIKPILYKKDPKDTHHKELIDSVSKLTDFVTRSAVSWERRTKKICRQPLTKKPGGELI